MIRFIDHYRVYERGDLDGKGVVFAREKNRVYLRCPQCSKIMEADDEFSRVLFDDGKIYDGSESCIVCMDPCCGVHFSVALSPSRFGRHRLVRLVRRLFGPLIHSAQLVFDSVESEKSLRVNDSFGMGPLLYVYHRRDGFYEVISSRFRVFRVEEGLGFEGAIRRAAERLKKLGRRE